jgi:hypothetical protein
MLLNYDDSLNGFWISGLYKYLDEANRDDVVPTIIIFNRLGQRISWFYEPIPPKNWHYGAQISVNQEGRIFRMLYHETEGIRVVEYLWKENNSEKKGKKNKK